MQRIVLIVSFAVGVAGCATGAAVVESDNVSLSSEGADATGEQVRPHDDTSPESSSDIADAMPQVKTPIPTPSKVSKPPAAQPGDESSTPPSEASPTPTTARVDDGDPPREASETSQDSAGVPQDLLEAMKADLADRLNVDRSGIEVRSGRAVTWSDGSLECPEPGESYTQALVDGYHVILVVEGGEYDYRSDGTRYFKLCQNARANGSGGAVDR